jgi:glycerate kinase
VHVCIAFDSFKDCATSRDLSFHLSHILSSRIDLQFTVLPIADGGEGSLDAILEGKTLEKRELVVFDPLQKAINAYYLYDSDNDEAFVELAIASGIERVKPSERNCWYTTAYGTGQLINDAIKRHAKRVYLFLGSSSTTEMGVSIAAACGWKFYSGNQLIEYPSGKDLSLIDVIEAPMMSKWPEVIACADVSNPLYGKNGAAFVYGPQKGATTEQIEKLDNGLRHVSSLIRDQFEIDLQDVQGAGAAGGIGAGAQAFFNAQIISGFDLIAETISLEKNIQNSDVVISGEGSFDEQSLNGKGVHRIIQLAKKHGKKTIIICGRCHLSADFRSELGDCTIYDLSTIFRHQEISKENTFGQLEQLKEQIITTITS